MHPDDIEQQVSYGSPESHADIEHRFNHHAASAPVPGWDAAVRAQFAALAHYVDNALPPGREKSLVLTNLEQAMFWANAAIARAK